MITIHNVDETLLFYGSLGAERKEVGNGILLPFLIRLPMSGFGEIYGGFVWLRLMLYIQRIW